ncbi:MAG: Hsp20/alpha crystallin family protein, partial [Chloroflexi bacterium]
MARRNVWEPMTNLITMQNAMDRLFDDVYTRRGYDWRQGERPEVLPIDAYVTGNELVIRASVPGARPEDVEITIEGETLT